MQRKTRKKRRVCKSCKTRFSGRYCPYCGAEYGHRHAMRSSGFFVGLLRFLLSILILAVVLLLVFAALDYVAAADGGKHTTAIAIVSSVENALPERYLRFYAEIKSSYLDPLLVWTRNILN